jgi:predicted enzyme related to lactoylglutathione lyase
MNPSCEGAYGRFAWYELTTTDVQSARSFYTKVIGWDVLDASAPGRPYMLFTAGPALVGGLLLLTRQARETGARPGWIGYVEVDDVDAIAERARQLGGVVHVEPTDVADISRFCIFADPQTARLAALKWRRPVQGQSPALGARGHVCWHELLAAKEDEALDFYADLFGWRRTQSDKPEFDTYQMFCASGQTIGGVIAKPPVIDTPFWLYYFLVGDVDAAARRVNAAGGRILRGPVELSGGSWIVQCADPQGAVFALAGTRQEKAIGYFKDASGKKWSW